MTPQHFHTISTSCAILLPLTQICFVFVSCVAPKGYAPYIRSLLTVGKLASTSLISFHKSVNCSYFVPTSSLWSFVSFFCFIWEPCICICFTYMQHWLPVEIRFYLSVDTFCIPIFVRMHGSYSLQKADILLLQSLLWWEIQCPSSIYWEIVHTWHLNYTIYHCKNHLVKMTMSEC